MAVGAATSELVKGNFSNAFSFLFVDADLIAAQERNRQYQDKLYEDKKASGYVSPALQAVHNAKQPVRSEYIAAFNHPATSVTGGFIEGAKEGLAAQQKFVKSSLTNVTGGILGFIPWWLWLVGGLALFFYMGGGKMLKGALAK